MTFLEWRRKHGARVSWREPFKGECWEDQEASRPVGAVFDRDIPTVVARAELWHLEDYRVTAVLSGPCVQLVKVDP